MELWVTFSHLRDVSASIPKRPRGTFGGIHQKYSTLISLYNWTAFGNAVLWPHLSGDASATQFKVADVSGKKKVD